MIVQEGLEVLYRRWGARQQGQPWPPARSKPVLARSRQRPQAAYEERHLPSGTLDNGRLAVLADALEEARCTDTDILSHLCGPGPHVRGCWAVDRCLGKS
jgi:hypothetical protein